MGARPSVRSNAAENPDPEALFDVAIIGGGPAGAAAAGLLAAWGHSVTVFSRSGSPSSRLAESLPPSTRKVLDRIGASSVVDGEGFVRSKGHTVWWGGSGPRIEEFPAGNTGYQVLRSDLDRVLLDLARANGARVGAETMIQGVEREGEVYRLDNATMADPAPIRARFILDCSGRSGVIARRGLRHQEEGPTTLALVGIWRSEEGWDVPDPTHTLVESYTDGWAWSVPVDDHVRYVALMVDPHVTGLKRGKEIGPIYHSEVAKTERFAALLEGGVPQGDPWACNASMYSAHRFADDRMLLVGDAASFFGSRFFLRRQEGPDVRLACCGRHAYVPKEARHGVRLSRFLRAP